MEKKKKAAIAAVVEYLKTEEIACAQIAQNSMYNQMQEQQPVSQIPSSLNLWGISGRQQLMQMRNLMQLKGLQKTTIH